MRHRCLPALNRSVVAAAPVDKQAPSKGSRVSSAGPSPAGAAGIGLPDPPSRGGLDSDVRTRAPTKRSGSLIVCSESWRSTARRSPPPRPITRTAATSRSRRRSSEPRPGRRGGLYDFTRRVLATDWGKELYLKRQGTVEPVFGQIKANRGANRFLRRGRSAVRSEWRLLTATHNLLKLHRHHLAAT